MAQVILDMGSGNTLKSFDIAKKMIDEVVKIDTHKHTIRFKAQLFLNQPPNVALDIGIFAFLYSYAYEQGYKVTASVFDKKSLRFLLEHDVPFIKIACRPDLYWLIGEIPRKIPVYVSVLRYKGWGEWNEDVIRLECVPQYPAKIDDYSLSKGLSDHTVGWDLWYRNKPNIFEKHYVLEHDDKNPDAGAFAATVEELKEIL